MKKQRIRINVRGHKRKLRSGKKVDVAKHTRGLDVRISTDPTKDVTRAGVIDVALDRQGKKGRKADLRQTSKNPYAKTDPRAYKWYEDPGKHDIKDVDTKGAKYRPYEKKFGENVSATDYKKGVTSRKSRRQGRGQLTSKEYLTHQKKKYNPKNLNRIKKTKNGYEIQQDAYADGTWNTFKTYKTRKGAEKYFKTVWMPDQMDSYRDRFYSAIYSMQTGRKMTKDEEEHQRGVEWNLKEGHHVPARVLKEYPKLAEEYSGTLSKESGPQVLDLDNLKEGESPSNMREHGWHSNGFESTPEKAREQIKRDKKRLHSGHEYAIHPVKMRTHGAYDKPRYRYEIMVRYTDRHLQTSPTVKKLEKEGIKLSRYGKSDIIRLENNVEGFKNHEGDPERKERYDEMKLDLENEIMRIRTSHGRHHR